MVQAANWYDQQLPGLGDDLLDEIGKSFRAIQSFPIAHPILDAPFRRIIVDRFPFALIYRVESEEIVVVAVANLKRRPNYWRRRGGT